MKSTRFNASIFSFIAVLTLIGCQCFEAPPVDPTPNVGSRHQQASHTVRRVAVLPVESNPHDSEYAERLRGSIVKSLRSCGAFEIIEINPSELGPCQATVVTNGKYDERQLVWLMKNYNVDAVMYSRMNHVRVVAPQSWSAICHIVDVREAFPIATVEGVWDLADPGDLVRFTKYVELTNMNFLDPEFAQQSPQAMAEFVGKEVAMEIF